MKKKYAIYAANLFFGFHYAFTIYINSSYLLQFISSKTLNILYALGALLNILLLFLVPRILKKIKTKPLAIIVVVVQLLSVFALSKASGPISASILFIIQQGLGPIMLYCMDLFLEATLPNEKNTGRARAYFVTAINLAVLVSFFIISRIIVDNHFSPIYVLSALMLLPVLLILIFDLKEYKHEKEVVGLKSAWKFIEKDADTLRILVSNFSLQFFYALMVIYLPLLLRDKIGFEWREIALILTIMVIPFVLIEIPLGKIMDKITGEREFLFLGFIIISFASFLIPSINHKSFIFWAALLFFSRIGASIVEICNESYFFKKIDEHHPSMVSLFRITQPVALVLAPFLAFIFLNFSHYQNLFYLLAFTSLISIAIVPKKDTR